MMCQLWVGTAISFESFELWNVLTTKSFFYEEGKQKTSEITTKKHLVDQMLSSHLIWYLSSNDSKMRVADGD